MNSLFGTDGVRGRANHLLTPELTLALARATASQLLTNGGRVIVGRDTRTSGPMLEAALASGFASSGADVCLAGIIPTPAISFLIKDERADLGAVISASHNPPYDNGIKFFDRHGKKLSVEQEAAIEAALASLPVPETRVGTIEPLEAASRRYAAFLAGTIDVDEIDLSGLTIVVDCAFGATGRIAPHVLRHLGADVVELHTELDGDRINEDCGSTNLEIVRSELLARSADLGIAFDGDGDRVLLVDRNGIAIDGDQMMGIAALHLHDKGLLNPPTVVTTVLTNLGLEKTLAEHGIRMIRTAVGDRNVAHAMRLHGAQIGGEQSGHIILSDHSPTGDGLLTAVKLLEFAHEAKTDLSVLAAKIPRFPQMQCTVASTSPAELLEDPSVRNAIESAHESIGNHGRVIVRASGTQPVLRIMVEADSSDLCDRVAGTLMEEIRAIASRRGERTA